MSCYGSPLRGLLRRDGGGRGGGVLSAGGLPLQQAAALRRAPSIYTAIAYLELKELELGVLVNVIESVKYGVPYHAEFANLVAVSACIPYNLKGRRYRDVRCPDEAAHHRRAPGSV